MGEARGGHERIFTRGELFNCANISGSPRAMEGISIMPGSIRPVSANCAAGVELKEATGCKLERERGGAETA